MAVVVAAALPLLAAVRRGVRARHDVVRTRQAARAEAVLGLKKVTVVFSGTHSGLHVPVLDAVDVYAQTKAEFGWDAQLAP